MLTAQDGLLEQLQSSNPDDETTPSTSSISIRFHNGDNNNATLRREARSRVEYYSQPNNCHPVTTTTAKRKDSGSLISDRKSRCSRVGKRIPLRSTRSSRFSPYLMLLVAPFLLIAAPLQRTLQAAGLDTPDEESDLYAQGNLFITFDAKVGRQYDNNPLSANLSELWCQATRPPGDDRLRLQHAQFVQVVPSPSKVHEAVVKEDRAHLRFGHVSTARVGKYRCEIRTHEGVRVRGNLFVYMRPVFHTNGSYRLDFAGDAKDPFHIVGSSMRTIRGGIAHLTCPVLGYPQPNITWLRDGQPLDELRDERIMLLSHGNHLRIRDVDYADDGVYSCVARNAFPDKPDGPENLYQAVLDRQLRVTSSLAWIVPLVVIILILLALFITIYACAAWKQYKHNQYNVAKRERRLRKMEEQNLRDAAEEDDEENSEEE